MHGYLVGMLIQIKLGKSIFEHALLKREMSCWLEIGHCHYSLVEIESSFVLCGGYLLIQSLWRKRTKLQASMNWHEVTNFVPLNIFFSPFPAGDDRGWRGGSLEPSHFIHADFHEICNTELSWLQNISVKLAGLLRCVTKTFPPSNKRAGVTLLYICSYVWFMYLQWTRDS